VRSGDDSPAQAGCLLLGTMSRGCRSDSKARPNQHFSRGLMKWTCQHLAPCKDERPPPPARRCNDSYHSSTSRAVESRTPHLQRKGDTALARLLPVTLAIRPRKTLRTTVHHERITESAWRYQESRSYLEEQPIHKPLDGTRVHMAGNPKNNRALFPAP